MYGLKIVMEQINSIQPGSSDDLDSTLRKFIDAANEKDQANHEETFRRLLRNQG
ncbi:MAG: hypothetical protein OXP11_01630 [Gammaproteobacteria bacterium]|nr:hypothetical protein [Gammaproteobacteria bacterium]